MLEDIDSLRVGRRAKEIAKGARHFDNNADRMRYAGFRAAAVPSGSGGLESAVRRVINHRMKGNSRFWLPERAEGMLHLRSHLKAGRWDEPCLSGCLTNPRSDLAGGRERAVRMSPRAIAQARIGRPHHPRGDAQHRVEGAQGVESPIETEDELVEMRGQVLAAHAVVGAEQPRLQVAEHDVDQGRRSRGFGAARRAGLQRSRGGDHGGMSGGDIAPPKRSRRP